MVRRNSQVWAVRVAGLGAVVGLGTTVGMSGASAVTGDPAAPRPTIGGSQGPITPIPQPKPSPTSPTSPASPKASKGAKTPAPNPLGSTLLTQTALSFVGSWGGNACIAAHQAVGGQCRQFVNCVVALATDGKLYPVDPSGDYQAAFAKAGTEVTPATATEGDIIQLGDHDADPQLHTAIVLVNHHDGSFDVVDANWVGQPAVAELVGVHRWTPPPQSRFWRLPIDGKAAPQPILRPAPPVLTVTAGLSPAGYATGPLVLTVTAPTAAKPRFWLDGTLTPATLQPDGTWKLDPAALPDGPHTLGADVVGKAGAISARTVPLTFTTSRTAPLGTVTGVAEGQVFTVRTTSPLSLPTPLTVSANDPAPITGLGLGLDGAPPTMFVIPAPPAKPATGAPATSTTATPAPSTATTTATPSTPPKTPPTPTPSTPASSPTGPTPTPTGSTPASVPPPAPTTPPAPPAPPAIAPATATWVAPAPPAPATPAPTTPTTPATPGASTPSTTPAPTSTAPQPSQTPPTAATTTTPGSPAAPAPALTALSALSSIDIASLPAGPHTLTLTITDAAGHTFAGPPITFTVIRHRDQVRESID